MSAPHFELSDGNRERVRTVVAAIDRHLACLSQEGTPEAHQAATRDLVSSWSALTDLLVLGPPPQSRECPFCLHTCMRLATRCGSCWKLLPPLPADDAEATAAVAPRVIQ